MKFPVDRFRGIVELLDKASSYLEEDAKQREESIDKLVEIGLPAVPYLCTRINTDNVMEHIALVNTLIRIGEPALDELHRALEREEGKAKELAIKIIARIGSEKSLNIFKKALDNPKWAFRSNAAAGLGKIKTGESREILLQLLKDEDDYVRLMALLSLADMADDKIIERIVDMMDDQSFIVRFGAAEVAADYAEAAVPMLEKKLGTSGKLIVDMLIIETLGNTGSESAAAVIGNYLDDDEPLLRAYAEIAYSKTAPTSKKELVEQKLEHETDPMVRKTLERAIENFDKRIAEEQETKTVETNLTSVVAGIGGRCYFLFIDFNHIPKALSARKESIAGSGIITGILPSYSPTAKYALTTSVLPLSQYEGSVVKPAICAAK